MVDAVPGGTGGFGDGGNGGLGSEFMVASNN
jgi:hypothetical protein